MSVWKIIESLISETKSYRGDSAVTFKAIKELAAKVGASEPNPKGGAFNCKHSFSPEIWKGWQPKLGSAIAMAATDTARDVYHHGVPQGGTVMKKAYGGRVVYQPAPIRPHSNDQLGSTMDRYDVIMVAELSTRVTKNQRSVEEGSLLRCVYSPAIGTFEERKARLEALLNGQVAPALRQRPQPERPSFNPEEPPKGPVTPIKPVPPKGS